MPHSIVSDICEGDAACVNACPVNCIIKGTGKNKKETDFFWIDYETCIDCGICLSVCPISGAVIPEENPEVQKI